MHVKQLAALLTNKQQSSMVTEMQRKTFVLLNFTILVCKDNHNILSNSYKLGADCNVLKVEGLLWKYNIYSITLACYSQLRYACVPACIFVLLEVNQTESI